MQIRYYKEYSRFLNRFSLRKRAIMSTIAS